jgi:hypothetical protein
MPSIWVLTPSTSPVPELQKERQKEPKLAQPKSFNSPG